MDLRSKDAIETSKQDNINMDNILIAEFMGVSIGDIPRSTQYTVEDLQYHTSWDWIMPVIDKIEAMGCEVVHRVGDCIVYKIDEKENYRCIIDMQGLNKLESTYKAVVEFIKNHEIL